MKGSYILIMENRKNSRIKAGSLGALVFPPGLYAYVGSAMRGLEARIDRHLRRKKNTFWHIDYFLKSRNVSIRQVYYKPSTRKEECSIARKLSRYGRAISGFGCSDCACEGHLFWLRDKGFPERLVSSRRWFRK
ncbi:MAG: GIY-YIG nuclease family protein [archaeon]|nr:MAG: GIY-YIG nuclease family protein [archaeon]